MPACEAVTAHADRFFGSQVCGVEATKKVENPWGYKDEVYLCDEHLAEYFGAFLEREYRYYRMLEEEGSETDD